MTRYIMGITIPESFKFFLVLISAICLAGDIASDVLSWPGGKVPCTFFNHNVP